MSYDTNVFNMQWRKRYMPQNNMKSTNASPSAFGWDFQCNAAIVLMLKNIKVASAVKVEGEIEDIEITLDSGNIICSQAKAVFRPYDDFSNVISKLKAGLKTLNTASMKTNVAQLIYITNSPDPFDNEKIMGVFGDSLTSKKYSELPEICQQQINNICETKNYTFDKNLFSVYVMHFDGDEENRYRVIRDLVNEFLNSVDLGDRGLGKDMLGIWQRMFFTNASHHNTSFSIKKESMVWPLIVSICKVNNEDALLSDVDEGEIDQIINNYKTVIDNNSERFDFVTKVLSAYNLYGVMMKGNERTKSFVLEHWQDFSSDFEIQATDTDILEHIVKLTISNIIKRRRNIVRIKSEVNL
jgi:hypothetical protein